MEHAIQVSPKLWVATNPVAAFIQPWPAILFAAKEPWHRNIVGYTSKGCPLDDPEYFYAEDLC